jgi:hypothetical protein
MKTRTSIPYILLLALALFAGCATPPSGAQLQRWGLIAEQAAYTGAAVDLRQHPEHRAQWKVGALALERLTAQPSPHPEALAAALQELPLSELHGPDGSLAAQGAVLVFDSALAFLPVDQAGLVPVFAARMAAGIQRALNTYPKALATVPGVQRSLPQLKSGKLKTES